MRKVIAAFNMTLDGFCDHTAGIPDEEIHLHYTHLLNNADVILYGRIAYQLMEYWRPFVKLKQQSGRDILVGSRSLIVQLLNLNLIDEFQLCIYPVVVGQGLSLFENIIDRKVFKLLKTKPFSGGSVLLYYQYSPTPTSL